jgi:hypothetical protein
LRNCMVDVLFRELAVFLEGTFISFFDHQKIWSWILVTSRDVCLSITPIQVRKDSGSASKNLSLEGLYYTLHRVTDCLSLVWIESPHPVPASECVFPPFGPKEGGDSDDWTDSLAICILCEFKYSNQKIGA